MTRLNQIHERIDLICGKERTAFFNPELKDWALDTAQMEIFNAELPTYGINHASQECLSPFERIYFVTNTNSPGGLVTLPSEYEYCTGIIRQSFDNITAKPTSYPVEIINKDEMGDRLKSIMIPTTADRPFAVRQSKKNIQFYPTVPTAGTIFYLKRPDAPNFFYTQPDLDPIYDDTNSTQLEWNETYIFKILFRSISILGISLDDDKLVAYSNMKTNQNP